jgi:hypothetical protein
MPDGMQHVPLPVQQQVLQIRPGRAASPVELGQALADGPGQRAGQLVLFLLHIQGRQAAGGETTPRIRSGGRTRSGAGTDATGMWRTSWSCRHTYVPVAWSYIASHGNPASAGVSMRSTTRNPSPRSAATAAVARYRPATSPVPSSPANSTCPAFRTGCSVSGSTRRLGTAEASTACCSCSRCASSASASSSTVADASPAGDVTTSTLNAPGAPPGPIATSMTVTTLTRPYPAYPPFATVSYLSTPQPRFPRCGAPVITELPAP